MCFISVSYEFFQLIINIYYDNLVTLELTSSSHVNLCYICMWPLVFYNVRPTCKSQRMRLLTTPHFIACPKTYPPQCSTPKGRDGDGEKAKHKCWLANRFPVWNSSDSFPKASSCQRGMSAHLGKGYAARRGDSSRVACGERVPFVESERGIYVGLAGDLCHREVNYSFTSVTKQPPTGLIKKINTEP